MYVTLRIDCGININCCLKGCVRGYGNYEELTSSGVDPTELFDDIEGSRKSPDLIQPDIVIKEYDDVVEEAESQQDIKSPDHIQLIPIEKARRHVRSQHSESNAEPSFDPALDDASTTPSLFLDFDENDKNKARINLINK